MAKRMLIDATHPEETRVVVVNGNRIEEFDFETSTKQQIKGNVYLAKVTRVEPSLQAAFVEYGGNRHGFLAFSEIHPDYYRIPVSDREALIADQDGDEDPTGESEDGVEVLGGDDVDEVPARRAKNYRNYKIQEVIKKRQILLVQVTKEERGNKGAALTTYLSLAGRYCVLMPNTPRSGGISRKITNATDRRRLKSIMSELSVPEGMAMILRTAGMERSRAEIKRDYDYLLRLWSDIRETTLQATAPAMIHEEANLIKRAIRDMYTRDLEEVLVEGDDGYKTAKAFMRTLMPSHAKKVKQYKDADVPLFQRYQVESQLDSLHSPTVQLRSGGYIVLNPTEALVAIDVNSGRATRERHIEETAYKTNMEAAEEIARQLRLRDLAGLVVIDFIDMEDGKNQSAVERRLKESMKLDRARIQIGKISPFGLLELSRQRLRPSVFEASNQICPRCGGIGFVRSVESTALHVLRAVEEEGIRRRSSELTLHVPTQVALYLFNQKRTSVIEVERRYQLSLVINADDTLIAPDFRLDRVKRAQGEETAEETTETVVTPAVPAAATPEPAEAPATDSEDGGDDKGAKRKRRSRRRRKKKTDTDQTPETDQTSEARDDAEASDDGDAEATEANDTPDAANDSVDGDDKPRRKRRSRRGGRRRSRAGGGDGTDGDSPQDSEGPSDSAPDIGPAAEDNVPAGVAAATAVALDAAADQETSAPAQTGIPIGSANEEAGEVPSDTARNELSGAPAGDGLSGAPAGDSLTGGTGDTPPLADTTAEADIADAAAAAESPMDPEAFVAEAPEPADDAETAPEAAPETPEPETHGEAAEDDLAPATFGPDDSQAARPEDDVIPANQPAESDDDDDQTQPRRGWWQRLMT